MSDCGGEEEKRESSLESSCQSKTDQSEDLSTLPVFSDEPGPSHSRLIKDAGGVGSMSTAGPPSATGMRKPWHENMTQDLRDLWVDELVDVLRLTPDWEVDARKIEGDIYESANSRDEYDHLLAEKINEIQKKIEERRKQFQRLSLGLGSTSMDPSSIRQPPYDSDLSLGRRTKLHQSADKTEVNSPSPWARTGEASHSLIKDAGEVGSMSTAGPPSATGMRKRRHDDMTQDLRDHWIDKLVDVLPLTPDLVVDARKVEGDIYESANNSIYYHLLTEKINKLEEEEERTRQRLSLDLWSTSMDESPIRQPPCSTSVSASSSSALPTQPSASQPTTAEEGATTQRDAGSTAINAQNGSVVSHPHTHIAGRTHFNVNNTPSVQTRARTDQTNVEEHGGEQRRKPGLRKRPDPRRENQQRTQSLPEDEEKRLRSVRKEFIKRVSDPVLNYLLDALLHDKVITSGEMESIQIKPRADRARQLIDTVLKKGKEACKILIDALCKVDPFLSETLELK
ncbi:uncharacterized protein LOC121906349 [Thunnus maccoyii]|uniref:uncharacterized protein LOC121906349 n=1 Tax=Thunnus maccoyii TaxID=8240 RepID=UPI001C4AF00F|nr:uncharacterized protein LOC121906349 [Thunnus maccoyii]XP_042281120.1 uncharacterized protein LOC121906349 [Thunnus maccoyii]